MIFYATADYDLSQSILDTTSKIDQLIQQIREHELYNFDCFLSPTHKQIRQLKKFGTTKPKHQRRKMQNRSRGR